MLTERYQSGEYLEAAPDWHASDAPWKAGKILQLLQRHAVVPRSVCDVGCGAGEILARLQHQLPETTRLVGWDVSPQAHALSRPKQSARLRFVQGDFLKESRDTHELLLLLDVLEHVPDYLGFLSALRTRAQRFVFHIPLDLSVQAVAGGSTHQRRMRERYGHLHYFTAESALWTLRDCGYLVEEAGYTWDGEAEGWRPFAAPGWRGRLGYPLTLAAYGLERLAFRLGPHVTTRMRPGYNLLVLARPA